MALRVLLADESTTIKKVMQLALQDFSVEVKAVHVGVDVVEVARSFQPDIIFADILLQKKNGYEVCAELKKEASLQSIPVVLMWSSFMDLDEKLAQQCRAEGRLEKPFDVENLRQVILQLVPRTHSQRLAHFLDFPENFTAPLRQEEAKKQMPPPATPPPVATSPASPAPEDPDESSWNMESFEDIKNFESAAETDESLTSSLQLDDSESSDDEDFSEFKLTNFTQTGVKPPPQAEPTPPPSEAGSDERDPWSHQDLSRFKLDLSNDEIEGENLEINLDLDENSMESNDFLLNREETSGPAGLELEEPIEPISASELQIETVDAVQAIQTPGIESQSTQRREAAGEPLDAGRIPQLSADHLEQIIRAQSRDIIEAVVRRVVPEIASDIIKQELQRLLEETAVRDEQGRESSR